MKKYIKKVISFINASIISFSVIPFNSSIFAAGSDIYLVRDPFYEYNSNYNYYESEHFQFIWGNSGDASKITSAFLEGNAENLEACWDVYMDELEMAEPTQSTNLSMRDGNSYKSNIYISGTGLSGMTDDWAYMSYDNQGFAYMFCCVDSMQYSPPSWVLPHEFGHVVTAHQLGWNNNKFSYAWWEAMGNWFREQYLYSDYSNDDNGYGTDFFETYLKNSSLTFPCGRDYYAAWPLLQYLTENPDNLSGYGSDFMKKMLQEGQVDEYPFDMIDRLADADLKDTLGHFAKRIASLDFENGDSYRARLNELLNMGSWNWQQIYTMLEPVSGMKNTYQVPTERAPQHGGLNIIPLSVNGSTINVNLNSLTNIEGADWRACIVQELSDGNFDYSELFSDGDNCSVNVSPQISNAYLTVIATPDNDTYTKAGLPYGYDSEFAEDKCSFTSKQQYPYSVKITGAEIMERPINVYSSGNAHANGGGFVASSARVDASVYVAPNAKVLGSAQVTGNARILGNAVVQDRATVSDNAVVSGYAIIAENASVSGNARVDDLAMVMGNSKVSGNAKVIESACVYGNYTMSDNACAKGMAFCMADGSISGQGVVDGDYYDDGGKIVTKGTAFGWVSSQSYVDSLSYTENLLSAYDFFDESSKSFSDRYNSTYGYNVNNPLWEENRTSANGVLTFNGQNQFAQLDRSILYTNNLDLQLSVLPRSDKLEQTILYLGNNSSYIKVIAYNENGYPEVILCDGKKTEKLTSNTPLDLGAWTTIRVIIDGDIGRLLINNQEVSSGTVAINPADIANNIDVTDSSAAYRLAADLNAENNFNGSFDFLRVFSTQSEDPSEIYTEREDISKKLIIGDLNFDNVINLFDLLLIKRWIFQDKNLQGDILTVSDLNTDNSVNVADVVIMQKYLLGQINSF